MEAVAQIWLAAEMTHHIAHLRLADDERKCSKKANPAKTR
jgi:hypothetical protein